MSDIHDITTTKSSHKLHTPLYSCSTCISAYLCPCHNFYLPSPSIPGSKRNQEESGDGGKIASIEEGVGNAQEPCTEAKVYHKEKSKEYVHRFYLVEPSVLRPKRPQPGTTKRQFLGHSQTVTEIERSQRSRMSSSHVNFRLGGAD